MKTNKTAHVTQGEGLGHAWVGVDLALDRMGKVVAHAVIQITLV